MPHWLARILWRWFHIGHRVKVPGRPTLTLQRKTAVATLISMKMDPKEAEEETGLLSSQLDQAPAYPYGLTLSLCDESLQKLGQATPPAVGSTVMVMARATVTSVSADQMQDGTTEQRLGLQITDMAPLAPESAGPKSAADTLYGS